MLLDAAGVLQGENIGVFQAAADMQLLIAENGVAPVRPVLLRLRAIKPEGIPSMCKELARKLIPKEVARCWIRRVVYVRPFDLESQALHILEVLGSGIHQTPHRNHGVDMLIVQFLRSEEHTS